MTKSEFDLGMDYILHLLQKAYDETESIEDFADEVLKIIGENRDAD